MTEQTPKKPSPRWTTFYLALLLSGLLVFAWAVYLLLTPTPNVPRELPQARPAPADTF